MGNDSNQNNEEVDLADQNNNNNNNNRSKFADQEEQQQEEECEYKVHISRIPTKFNEEIVERILKETLLSKQQENEDNQEQIELSVELVYPLDTTEEVEEKGDNHNSTIEEQKEPEETYVDGGGGGGYADEEENNENTAETKEHRGFGFVTFKSYEIQQRAINLQTIKGGRKVKSTKKHTMYIRPYDNSKNSSDDVSSIKNQCYLWQQYRCPYGDECKFNHTGPGGCKIINNGGGGGDGNYDDDETKKKKKKGRCFAFKKGKCKKGDSCPFSHDFTPKEILGVDESKKDNNTIRSHRPDSEKDCINWKTKGKCRKGDKCPYKHDPNKLKKERKRKNNNDESQEDGSSNNKKEKQPLSVRVFGLNYETTIEDVTQFFDDCGKINNIEFPTFEDSGRSKGYCEIKFCSPKAVTKAIEKDGSELMGRWLQIQVGKMYLKQWESNHKKQRMM